MEIRPQPKNLKRGAIPLAATRLDALAQRMPVLKAISADRGRQGARQIVYRDLKPMDFFEGLNGPFRRLEMLHRGPVSSK
jgi:hypothetical protein